MKRNLLYILVLLGFVACHDIQVGFLDAENAFINPDTLTVKAVESLDDTPPTESQVKNPDWDLYKGWGFTDEQLAAWGVMEFITQIVVGEDYERVQNNIPWVSYKIQGVEGTLPLSYELTGAARIDENGTPDPQHSSVELLLEYTRTSGDGTVQVDLHNEIPAGEYVVDVTVSNPGYSHKCEKILTIIVE
jgi:hypothetical protein